MRKIVLLFSFACISLMANAQERDDTCDPVDSLMTITSSGELTIFWNRNDTAIAYNYRYRILGDTTWEVDATLSSFFMVSETDDCVEYEVSISTVCAFDTSTFTLDTVISFCPNAVRPVLADPKLLSVYPVPFSESLSISSKDATLDIEHVIVRSISGQQMINYHSQDGQQLNASTVDWTNGIYLLEIKTNKGWHFQKVLKL